jgi:GT2 family glycosyltransferase
MFFPAWPKTVHGQWMDPEGQTDLVSVILPTYDRAAFLGDALTSCVQQSYRPLEVIAVDDGSTDDTANLVRQWQEDCAAMDGFTLRYVHQPNRGVSAARNLGLIQSRGEYIQYLDSDDVMHPQKIELHHAAMETASRDHVWSESFTGDEDVFSPFSKTRQREHGTKVLAEDAIDGPVPIAAVHKGLYRRSACYRIGPWNETLTRWEDKEYNLRLACLGPRSAKVEARLYKMRAHDKGRLTDTRTQAAGVENGLRAARVMERDLRVAQSCEVPASFSLRDHYLRTAILALRVGADDGFEECIRRGINVSSSRRGRLPLQVLQAFYRIFGRRAARWLQQTYTSYRLGR